MFELLLVIKFYNGYFGWGKMFKCKKFVFGCLNFKLEWKLFIEQIFFNVFSDL